MLIQVISGYVWLGDVIPGYYMIRKVRQS